MGGQPGDDPGHVVGDGLGCRGSAGDRSCRGQGSQGQKKAVPVSRNGFLWRFRYFFRVAACTAELIALSMSARVFWAAPAFSTATR